MTQTMATTLNIARKENDQGCRGAAMGDFEPHLSNSVYYFISNGTSWLLTSYNHTPCSVMIGTASDSWKRPLSGGKNGARSSFQVLDSPALSVPKPFSELVNTTWLCAMGPPAVADWHDAPVARSTLVAMKSGEKPASPKKI